MNVCSEQLRGICALFYENRLGTKKSVISFVYLCPNTGTAFNEPYHSNHVISPPCSLSPSNLSVMAKIPLKRM